MKLARYKLCLLSPIVILSMFIAKPVVAEKKKQPVIGDWEIRRWGDKESLVAQNLTRVTGIEIEQTDDGLNLILKTVAGSERLVPLIVPEGNEIVIDILDATLAFSIRNGVTEVNPAPGIRRVAVNEGDDNSIQVRIVGQNQTPSAEVVPGTENLVLSIADRKSVV